MNIEGFEGEKIECSEFTEKVGKDIIDYKFEYKNNLKVIELLTKELAEKDKLLELANNKISELVPLKNEAYEKYCEMSKELETYKKIAYKLAELINTHDIDEDVCKQMGKDFDCTLFNQDEKFCVQCIIDWAKREVKK